MLLPALVKAEALQVSGAIYPDFTRIVFNASTQPMFQVSLSGDNLQINFTTPVQANFREMLKTLRTQVASASLEDGGKRIRIKLKTPDVRLRKFQGQNFFGVDLVKQDSSSDSAQSELITDAEKKARAKREEASKKREAFQQKQEAKSLPPAPVTKVKTAPPAEIKPKPITPKPVAVPKPTPEPKPVPAPVPTLKAPAQTAAVKPAAVPAYIPAPKQEEKKPVKTETKIPAITPSVRTIIQKPEQVARVMPTQATKLLTVPWTTLVPAAIFVRDETLWAIFDSYAQVTFSDLNRMHVTKSEQIADRRNTILKLQIQPELAANADQIWANREQNNWVIYYGKPPEQKTIPLIIPEDEKQNEIRFGVRHAAEPLQMEDPKIGDALFIVPVRDPANRVVEARRFIEFDILPTVQGVVLVRRSEIPDFKVSREGVSITSPNTLFISSRVQSIIKPSKPDDLQKNTMYPFAHRTEDADFMPNYYQYLEDIQAEPDGERSKIHLKMAEHYFLNGFYAESLGLLRDILIDDPEFAATAGIKPMIAGNLFMMGRFDQSADTFLNILNNKEMPEYAEEQKLWYWASLKMMEQEMLVPFTPIEGFNPAAALNTYLSSYPYPLRRKLMMMQIQDLVKNARVGEARKWIKEVAALDPTQEESEMLDFMEASALLVEKKNEQGLGRLENVLKNAKTGRVRTLALLESTRIAKEEGKETLPEIIQRLESGKLDWRGDAVEFELLKRLGQYYFDNKQYAEGLRVWRELVTQFSGNTESLRVAGDMATQFAKLFGENGEAYKLLPLQTLSMFFEFNELMPVGVEGDRISRHLADYMAGVDLVDNAAAILTHQVRFRSQGEDRAQLAAKLIDLHLSSNRPDLAQEVMNAMVREKIPASLKDRFQLLNAEILIQQGKYPEALKIIEGQKSKAASDMQLAVFWKQQEWERVISILEPEVKARATNIESLKSSEEENALRLAIAYSKMRRFDDLKWLREAYNKRIKKPEIDDALDFVTDSKTPIDHQALEQSLEMDKVTSFMDKYRLPEPPPPPPAPEEPKAEEKTETPKEGEAKKEEDKKSEEEKKKE